MSLEKVKAVKVKLQCRNELDKPTRYLTVVWKHDEYKIRGLHGDSDDSCVGCSDLSWTATIGHLYFGDLSRHQHPKFYHQLISSPTSVTNIDVAQDGSLRPKLHPELPMTQSIPFQLLFDSIENARCSNTTCQNEILCCYECCWQTLLPSHFQR